MERIGRRSFLKIAGISAFLPAFLLKTSRPTPASMNVAEVAEQIRPIAKRSKTLRLIDVSVFSTFPSDGSQFSRVVLGCRTGDKIYIPIGKDTTTRYLPGMFDNIDGLAFFPHFENIPVGGKVETLLIYNDGSAYQTKYHQEPNGHFSVETMAMQNMYL